MEPAEFKTIIKDVLKEVLDEERKSYWVDPEQHYRDHQQLQTCNTCMPEIRKNHAFVSAIRSSADVAEKVSVRIIVSSIVIFIIGALYATVRS